MENKKENASSTADRELRISRVLNAPRELVFELWTTPDHIKHWWGPNGFTNTIFKMDVREGGEWDFIMHGPDGTDYKNTHVYAQIVKNEKIVLKHVTGPKFEMNVTFEAQGNKTLLTITSLFESAAQLQEVIKVFKADVGLQQNVQRLDDYINKLSARRDLVITRIFNAPRALVFEAWTNPKHLQKWWGPKDFTNPVCKADARPGGVIHIDMTGPDGTVYPCIGNYGELDKPNRLTFTIKAFEDESGNAKLEVHYTVTLEEHENGTKFTLSAHIVKLEPEIMGAVFGMEIGWNQSIDRLVALLSEAA